MPGRNDSHRESSYEHRNDVRLPGNKLSRIVEETQDPGGGHMTRAPTPIKVIHRNRPSHEALVRGARYLLDLTARKDEERKEERAA